MIYEIRKSDNNKHHNKFVCSTLDKDLAEAVLRAIGKKYHIVEVKE